MTKRYYHEGADDRVLAEFNGGATPTRQRYYIWGNYIDELLVLHDDSEGGDHFVCHNHLFSPVALLDDAGLILEHYEYDAYGKPTIYTGDGGDSDWWDGDETTSTSSAQGLAYLFTGREVDVLDGGDFTIQYNRARYYDHDTGRWYQQESLGDKATSFL